MLKNYTGLCVCEICFVVVVTFGLALPATGASELPWLPAPQSASACNAQTRHH